MLLRETVSVVRLLFLFLNLSSDDKHALGNFPFVLNYIIFKFRMANQFTDLINESPKASLEVGN
ncbi:hypothetical protein F444_13070 [Phytophthora nicotianae P1976]|uniref:Uncharacterized protein n=1 Tax=Phytophthora nicotianae P1976 TaxID=1317066 RepID=A0A080ZV01_PHYNI|nr:hypothetical protein F444_13070 [Phytophthora nicotianae P1976]